MHFLSMQWLFSSTHSLKPSEATTLEEASKVKIAYHRRTVDLIVEYKQLASERCNESPLEATPKVLLLLFTLQL